MARFMRGEDDLLHCPEEGCDASYKLPQHLGLHLRGKHGREGQSAAAKYRRKSLAHPPQQAPRKQPKPKASMRDLLPARRLTGPNGNGHREPLAASADQICLTVLAELSPSGVIRIAALGPYLDWVRSTETFMETLSSLS